MRKEKRTYSLTAKERKALRLQEQEKRNKKNGKQETISPSVPQEISPVSTATETTAQASQVSRRPLWIAIVGAITGLIVILTAVLLLVFNPFDTKSNSIYPRAIITLDDGRKLTLTLWEEDAPIAATNFIFLSKIGFFTYSGGDSKGSLIYDVQEGKFMRFGAYYDYNSSATRYKQTDFLNGIPRKLFNVVSKS